MIVVLTALAISIGGVLAIHSATHGDNAGADFAHKQSAGIVLGLVAMIAIGFCNYHTVIPHVTKWLYGINIALLLLVVVRGHSSHGAQRWIPIGPVQFQPSEFAKFALIVCLALYLYDRRHAILDFRTILGSLAYIAVPLVLIFKQPDLGTALVILSIWLGMLLIAGAKWQHLLLMLVGGIVLFTLAWHTPLIKDYQKHRLTAFIDPASDPHDTGYHLHQSEIAIGSGGVSGQGYLRGMQSNGHFIPEQHTDFIFTIVGEEGGLLGACLLIGLYILLIERLLVILIGSDDLLGRLLVAGVISMLAFHIIVNIGMTIGVMPVTGVPLPFFSYGLSSLLIGMASLGLALSVAARKSSSMFN